MMAIAHPPIISSQVVSNPAIIPSLDGFTASQSYSNFNTPQTFTIANSVSGNLMVMFITVIIGVGFTAPTVSSVVGTHDGGWTTRSSQSDNSNANRAVELYATPNSSSDTVTITLSGACNANGCAMTVAEIEIQNSTGFDSGGPQTNTGSGISSSTTITFSLPALVIGFTEQLSPTTISYGAGFSGIYNFGGQAEENDAGHSTGGSTSVAFSYSPSATWRNIADSIDGTAASQHAQNSATGFFYMAWRILPFNLSQTGNSLNSGNNSHRDATVILGLFNNTAFQGIGIEMSEVDNIADSNFLSPGIQREAVALTINHPQTGTTTNCFATYMGFLGSISPFACTKAFPAIMYTGSSATLDLNAPHVFTLEMNLQINGKSWIGMQVDNDGWLNVTQTACNCIEGTGETYASLFPYIQNAYAANNLAVNPPTPNQSLGTLINYVLVDDYVPASLPAPNQILPSGATPPSTLPQPGVTGSITDFIQFEANSISPGNLYAGGMLLTIIVSGTLFAVMFGLSRKLKISVKGSGLFFTMFVLVMSFLFFIASVLPIWIPVMMTIITAGIVFGVIKTGDAGGGLVPD